MACFALSRALIESRGGSVEGGSGLFENIPREEIPQLRRQSRVKCPFIILITLKRSSIHLFVYLKTSGTEGVKVFVPPVNTTLNKEVNQPYLKPLANSRVVNRQSYQRRGFCLQTSNLATKK